MSNVRAVPLWTVSDAAAPVEAPSPPGFEATLASLMDQYGVTMSIRNVAKACGLTKCKGVTAGEPRPVLVLELVRAGRLKPVDGTVPQHRWVFASAAVAAYIVGGGA